MVTKTRGSSLGKQLNALRSLYPEAPTATWKKGQLRWIGNLQPTALCRIYTVQVSYRPRDSRPIVTVLKPQLVPPPKARLPHTFRGDELCLHLQHEWNSHLLIAETIVPWASEWLLHYELWLATGEWHGGGHEPEAKIDPLVRVASETERSARPS